MPERDGAGRRQHEFFLSDSSYDDDDGDGLNSPFSTFISGLDQPGDEYPNFFGTSASAPHVAAVAALMLDKNPVSRVAADPRRHWRDRAADLAALHVGPPDDHLPDRGHRTGRLQLRRGLRPGRRRRRARGDQRLTRDFVLRPWSPASRRALFFAGTAGRVRTNETDHSADHARLDRAFTLACTPMSQEQVEGRADSAVRSETGPTNEASGAQSMQPMLAQIRADAAQRIGVAVDPVKVLAVGVGRLVRWFAGGARSRG